MKINFTQSNLSYALSMFFPYQILLKWECRRYRDANETFVEDTETQVGFHLNCPVGKEEGVASLGDLKELRTSGAGFQSQEPEQKEERKWLRGSTIQDSIE